MRRRQHLIGFWQHLTAAVSLAMTVVTLVTGMALAQFDPQGEPIILTSDKIEAFIASFAELQQLSESLSEEYDLPDEAVDDPAEAYAVFLQYQAAMSRLDGAAQAYGFSGFMEWLMTLSATAHAYYYAESAPEIDSAMAEAREQIENDPNLSPEQKQMILAQMEAAMTSSTAMRPPQENIDAVAPYAEQLKSLFEAE